MGPVRQNPIQRTVSLFICMCIALCTIVAHNIAQNRPDNFPPYPPDNHHISDDVYLREGGCILRPIVYYCKRRLVINCRDICFLVCHWKLDSCFLCVLQLDWTKVALCNTVEQSEWINQLLKYSLTRRYGSHKSVCCQRVVLTQCKVFDNSFSIVRVVLPLHDVLDMRSAYIFISTCSRRFTEARDRFSPAFQPLNFKFRIFRVF